MKNNFKTQITLILFFIATLGFAQDKETRDLRRFTEIKVTEGIELIAKKGNTNSIELDVDRIDLDRVITEVRGDRLIVQLRRNSYSRRNNRRIIKAYLTYTEEIEEIAASTSAEVIFEDMIKGKELTIQTSTSGSVEVKAEVTYLNISASTSGRVEITGEAQEVEAKASTGGTIYAYDVEAEEVYAKANTGADVRVNATDRLRANANTGGTVSYRGRPRADVRSNTGGQVRRAR
ncbi:head GIN domain-containing protein [Roseivirga misakiensis]|nr:head GIN domain-containing protein [Roseivirga misakiensis]